MSGLSDDEFGPLDPKKKFYAFNFGDESYSNRFIERKDDLMNESGLILPVESKLFDVVFVSQRVLSALKDDGTSVVPVQAVEPLSESLKTKQKLLHERHSVVSKAFREFVSFAPNEPVFRQWIDNNPSATGSKEDRYCLFDRKWIQSSLEHLDAMKQLCNPVDIQKSPKTFFDVLTQIDLAIMELDTVEEHTKRLEALKEGIGALQKVYEIAVKELVPPYDIVKKLMEDEEKRRRDYTDDLVRRSEEAGVELSPSAKDFLLKKPTAQCNPLEPLCHTFCLPADRKPSERTGVFKDLSRLELEKKCVALEEKNHGIEREIHLLEERLSKLTEDVQKEV